MASLSSSSSSPSSVKLLLSLASLCATANAEAAFSASQHASHRIPSGLTKVFKSVLSSKENALISDATSNTDKSSEMKWLVFPDLQSEQHLDGLHSENIDTSSLSSFFVKHRAALNLRPDCDMVLTRSQIMHDSGLKEEKYSQFIAGVRVFAGDFHVTSSSETGRVLQASGLPVTPRSSSKISSVFSSLPALTSSLGSASPRVLRAVSEYLRAQQAEELEVDPARLQLPTVHLHSARNKVELVWLMSEMRVSRAGEVSLAYYVDGHVTSDDGTFQAFDIFVDVDTLEVVDFIVKYGEVAPSPFASPITDADIYCYDQYLKDYNDDVIDDNYYYPDPDRFSNATLVFDTTSGDYVYPTTDEELNLLVDNSLYMTYLFYSLSNGVYLTWAKEAFNLNIEYNLSISNAYFDGEWGIHFGTGYITDDVVSHEWGHGYTQTANGLIYAFESGAMNEAFSDIFGEAVDILNGDTSDPDALRTVWPTECHTTLNNNYGVPPGSDVGTRWSMGENVTTSAANKDGSLRDMYKPECFNMPGDTFSSQYVCTTWYDNGGVHLNSGILNRLFATLIDGGDYEDPSSADGGLLSIAGLGWTKGLNLFWRTHQVLTPTSQFLDLSIALTSQCRLNIGKPLFEPNVLSNEISVSPEVLTTADCDNVDKALDGSGMNRVDDFCPNIDCVTQYSCRWGDCPAASTELFYEPLLYTMGQSRSNSYGKLLPTCTSAVNKIARVFPLDFNFTLSCIQIGYLMMGQTVDAVLEIYVDSDGCSPDSEMTLVASQKFTTVNAYSRMQVQTLSFPDVVVPITSPGQTMVIQLVVPVLSEGVMTAGGQLNPNSDSSCNEATYVSGDCMSGEYMDYNQFASTSNTKDNQWYVRVHGSGGVSSSSSSSDDSLSAGAIVGIVFSVLFVAGFVFLGVMFIRKQRSPTLQPMDQNLLSSEPPMAYSEPVYNPTISKSY